MQMVKTSKKSRKESPYSFEQYLLQFAEHIRHEQARLRKLTEMSVELRRRQRGLTLSDLCGGYGTRKSTQGVWFDYDEEVDGEIHPINIVQPTFRANTNACLQANSAVEISAMNASARNRQAAFRWQRVADHFERTGWTEEQRNIVFDGVQCDGTVLIEIIEKECGARALDAAKNAQIIVAAYRCLSCSEKGTQALPPDAPVSEGAGKVVCPKCGGNADGLIKKIDDYRLETKKIAEVDFSHKIIPFYNFSIDRYGAKLGGIQTAKWLQIHDLITRTELEADYPHFLFSSSTNWCYQLRCAYALAAEDWGYLNYNAGSFTAFTDLELFERREIYLNENLYKNYVAPADYEFRSGSGKITFSIKRGQTLCEALGGRKGFKFLWMDERLLDIPDPEKEETDFRKRFADVHWLRDSSSYYSSPNYSIKILQDDITLANTINHNIAARNAVNPIYYRSDIFEKSDFQSEFIGTKNAALLEGGSLGNAVVQLPVPTPSPHLAAQLRFLWEVKDSVSLVQPAMRGEMQKGETFGAQRQQLEQSYGLLTSVLKSFAKCKVDVTRFKMERAKKKWTLEQFQQVASNFGEIWTEEDVQEMCEMDFERDFQIDYRDGSEMPQSNLMRELKFMQGFMQVKELIGAGVPLAPDKLQKLLQKIDEFAEFDFDLTGLETAEILAQKRILELQTLCFDYQIPFEQIEMMKNSVALQDAEGNPISSFDMLIEEIFYRSTIRFNQYEDLAQQRLAFIEALNTETGKRQPNYLFIELITVVTGMIEEALRELQGEEMMNDPQVQAELALRQQEKQEAANEAERLAQIEVEKEERTRAAANEEKAADFIARNIEAEAAHERELELAENTKKRE